MKGPWRRVIFAADCARCPYCGERICPVHAFTHFADCSCPGPHQEDEYEYRWEPGRGKKLGRMLARKKEVSRDVRTEGRTRKRRAQ